MSPPKYFPKPQAQRLEEDVKSCCHNSKERFLTIKSQHETVNQKGGCT